MIKNISFCAKIPIATCSIQNTKTREFEEATIFEYDCKDYEDIEKLDKITNEHSWQYVPCIFQSAVNKHKRIKAKEYNCEHIYALENKNGETLNLCSTREDLYDTTINFIESKKTANYKYCGQNMMATIVKKTMDELKNYIVIHRAIYAAWKFYMRTCGFTPTGIQYNNNEIDMIMGEKSFKEFVDKTEETTGREIKYCQ